MKTIEKVNSLKLVINCQSADGNDLIIKIRLSDDCKNGHNDFAITGDIYEKGRRGDRAFISGGCIHDEILKVRPDLKLFVDLHLSNVNGTPMHAIENGYYHLKNTSLEVARKYLRVTDAEIQLLNSAPDKMYFTKLLFDFNIVARWKQEAKKAIKLLEEMTGESFEDNSTKLEKVVLSKKDKADIEQKIKEGFYNTDQIEARKVQKIADDKAKAIKEVEEYRDKKIQEQTEEASVKIAVLNCGLPIDNFIYYKHNGEAVFNWLDYHKKISAEQLADLIRTIDYTKLPANIKFKLK